MRIIVDNVDFKFYEIESESVLKEYIENNCGIIVGNSVQVKNKFYMIEYVMNDFKVTIGILNEDHGIVPIVVKLKKINALVIASDRSVYVLNFKADVELKNIVNDSLVFDLMVRENEDRLFVVCELGIHCMTIMGDKVWSYDSDIISDFSFCDSYAIVTVNEMDYKISLLNGQVM